MWSLCRTRIQGDNLGLVTVHSNKRIPSVCLEVWELGLLPLALEV